MNFGLVPPRAPTCHPDRRLYAKGLCTACYQRHRHKVKSERATCHPDRAHKARGLCDHCYRALCREKEPLEKKRARWRRAALKHSFGLTERDFDLMFAEQGGKCGMCSKQFGKSVSDRPHVDHCHSTGRVRGLLCLRCNSALGYYEKYGELSRAYLSRTAERAIA